MHCITLKKKEKESSSYRLRSNWGRFLLPLPSSCTPECVVRHEVLVHESLVFGSMMDDFSVGIGFVPPNDFVVTPPRLTM